MKIPLILHSSLIHSLSFIHFCSFNTNFLKRIHLLGQTSSPIIDARPFLQVYTRWQGKSSLLETPMKTSTHQPSCVLKPDRRIKTSTRKPQSKSAQPSPSPEASPPASGHWGTRLLFQGLTRQQHVQGMEGTQCMGAVRTMKPWALRTAVSHLHRNEWNAWWLQLPLGKHTGKPKQTGLGGHSGELSHTQSQTPVQIPTQQEEACCVSPEEEHHSRPPAEGRTTSSLPGNNAAKERTPNFKLPVSSKRLFVDNSPSQPPLLL